MKRFKKLLCGLLAAISALSLAACNIEITLGGSSGDSPSDSPSTSSSDPSTSSPDSDSSSDETDVFTSSSYICDCVVGGGSSSEDTTPDDESSSSTDTTSNDTESDESSTPDGDSTPETCEHVYDDFMDVSCNECGDEREKITVKFYHCYGMVVQEILDGAIEDFNKLYPNVKIIHDNMGGYDDLQHKIETEIIGGYAPSIAVAYPQHIAAYNQHKALTLLDEYEQSLETVFTASGETETLGLSQEQRDALGPYYGAGRIFDDAKTLYSLPMSLTTDVLYYNKTFFDTHDLTVPTTWTEMEEVCQAIKNIASENGQSRSVPLSVDSEFNWFANTCKQIGSTMISLNSQNPFTFNNAENRTFAQQYRSWYQNGYVITSSIYGSYTSDLFVSGECYMSIGNQSSSAWYCPNLNSDNSYPFEVGVAPIPQADPKNPKSLSRLLSLCLFKQADERETQAAWLFAKHLATDVVFQAQLSLRQGSSPVNTLVYENHAYQAKLARADGNKYLLESAILASMEQGGFLLSPSIYTNQLSSTISDLLTDCLSVKLNAGQTDAQLIEALFNQAETKLKEQCGL